MLLIMIFKALQAGEIKLETEFMMSEYAWRTGGAPSRTSAMFVPLGKTAKVDEMLQGIIVQSGNDASIAMAERLGGSEQNFAEAMTEQARRLGLKKSVFRNATGLYHPEHLLTVRELALLARIIIKDYPEYYPICSARVQLSPAQVLQPQSAVGCGARRRWTEDRLCQRVGLRHRRLRQAGQSPPDPGHRTALRRQKSARTRLAGCLSGASRTSRRSSCSTPGEVVGHARVWGGERMYLPLAGNDGVNVVLPRFPANQKLSARIFYKGPLKPPIRKGDQVATLRVTTSAEPPARCPFSRPRTCSRQASCAAGLTRCCIWLPGGCGRGFAREQPASAAQRRGQCVSCHRVVSSPSKAARAPANPRRPACWPRPCARSGIDGVLTREPGGSPFAEQVRDLILDPATAPHSPLSEALLFYAARADHIEKVIRPALVAGRWVISDRFSDSTRVYQVEAGGLPLEVFKAFELIVVKLTYPDLTFVLDIPAESGLRRATTRRSRKPCREALPMHMRSASSTTTSDCARASSPSPRPSRTAARCSMARRAGRQIARGGDGAGGAPPDAAGSALMARAPRQSGDRGAARSRPPRRLPASARNAALCSATRRRRAALAEPLPAGACIMPGCLRDAPASARRRWPIGWRGMCWPARTSGTDRQAARSAPAVHLRHGRLPRSSHPGLLVLRRPFDPEGKRFGTAIPVDEVRRLKSFLGLTSARTHGASSLSTRPTI